MKQIILLLSFNSVTQQGVLYKNYISLNFYVERRKCITVHTDKQS
jgi:hypothetical protein